jgi:hypothetical protein
VHPFGEFALSLAAPWIAYHIYGSPDQLQVTYPHSGNYQEEKRNHAENQEDKEPKR